LASTSKELTGRGIVENALEDVCFKRELQYFDESDDILNKELKIWKWPISNGTIDDSINVQHETLYGTHEPNLSVDDSFGYKGTWLCTLE
jgi:hypothetical protein